MKRKNDNTGAYQKMAAHYDVLMGSNKYSGWQALIKDVVNKYGIVRGRCLDLACGTGNISRLVQEEGFSVVGVDISGDMIKVAREKLPTERFIKSDIRRMKLSSKIQKEVTLVVCFYDSLNYLLTDEDMYLAFRAVYDNVSHGTIFLFDMNSRAHVRVAQKFFPRVFENGELLTIFRFGGEGRLWTLDMDFFTKEGPRYRRFHERHTERGYDRSDIEPLLKKAGFKVREVREETKMYEDKLKHLSRLYFIAQKI
jgi:SAM-dependent methyltransferase